VPDTPACQITSESSGTSEILSLGSDKSDISGVSELISTVQDFIAAVELALNDLLDDWPGRTVLPLETTLRMTACPVNERLQTGMD
jgi:hypothetical protein